MSLEYQKARKRGLLSVTVVAGGCSHVFVLPLFCCDVLAMLVCVCACVCPTSTSDRFRLCELHQRTSTLQHIALQAANRSDQDVCAKEFLSRWRHEMQIALLQRKAAMYRAVLPKRGAAAQWPLTGSNKHVPSHRGRAETVDRDSGCAGGEEVRPQTPVGAYMQE